MEVLTTSYLLVDCDEFKIRPSPMNHVWRRGELLDNGGAHEVFVWNSA